MTTQNEVLGLIQSHFSRDNARFRAIAQQIAANSRKDGKESHLSVSIDRLLQRDVSTETLHLLPSMAANVINATLPKTRLSDLELAPDVAKGLRSVILEQVKGVELRTEGLAPSWRVLLIGPPGTGKTYSASALAGELSLPLFKTKPDMAKSHLGETADRFGYVFDAMKKVRGVYMIDEFDSFGDDRSSKDRGVPEYMKITNALLQFFEQGDHDSILVCATNRPESLDSAFFRRFDVTLTYANPNEAEISRIIRRQMKTEDDLSSLTTMALGLSHSEVTSACYDARKQAILEERPSDKMKLLEGHLALRHRTKAAIFKKAME